MDSTTLVLFGVSVVIGLVCLCLFGVVVVPEGTCRVKQNLRCFDSILEPGVHFFNPLTTTFASVIINGMSIPDIPLTPEQYDPTHISAYTSETAVVMVDVKLRFQIIDVRKAVYRGKNITALLFTLLQSAINQETPYMSYKLVLESGNVLAKKLLDNINVKLSSQDFGVILTDVVMERTWLSDEMRKRIDKDLLAEMEAKEALKRSEIFYQQEMANATAQREVDILKSKTETDVWNTLPDEMKTTTLKTRLLAAWGEALGKANSVVISGRDATPFNIYDLSSERITNKLVFE